MYLSEIAPVALRGLCGVFNQFSIIFGVLVAEVIGLNDVLGKKDTWQFALGKTKTIPAGTKHWHNVDAMPWGCIYIDATLYTCHVPGRVDFVMSHVRSQEGINDLIWLFTPQPIMFRSRLDGLHFYVVNQYFVRILLPITALPELVYNRKYSMVTEFISWSTSTKFD